MPGDPPIFREYAKRCWAMASETTDPVWKKSLLDNAQQWARLAELETTHTLLDAWVPEKAKKVG